MQPSVAKWPKCNLTSLRVVLIATKFCGIRIIAYMHFKKYTCIINTLSSNLQEGSRCLPYAIEDLCPWCFLPILIKLFSVMWSSHVNMLDMLSIPIELLDYWIDKHSLLMVFLFLKKKCIHYNRANELNDHRDSIIVWEDHNHLLYPCDSVWLMVHKASLW